MKHPAYYNIISLSIFLILLTLSVILDVISPFPITTYLNNYSLLFSIGIFFLIFGFIGKSSVLVSHDHHYRRLAASKKHEKRGLYKIMNFPLFESSFFMMLGLALILDKSWILIAGIVFMITHIFYLHVFERRAILEHYREK